MQSYFDGISENSSYSYLVKFLADILMIFVPSIGYFFQAKKFKETKSSKGFAKFLCLLILIANILRVFFWFGKKFSLILLYQSIVVILSQIYLIHVYLEYQEDFPVKSEKNISEYLINWSETLSPRKIWNWDDEIEYYKFIIFLVVIFSIICRIGKNSSQLFEILGIISVSFETFIELPQIKENCMTKDIRNLSGEMVFMWFAGDLFKTSYNFIYHSPLQIIIGGIIMNLEDIILSSQVIYFDENNYINKLFQGRPKYVNLDEVKLSESNRIDFDTDKNSSL
jgi:hypothetical protein